MNLVEYTYIMNILLHILVNMNLYIFIRPPYKYKSDIKTLYYLFIISFKLRST